ncbi:MAG TPA: hypothetical protein PLM01_11860 [Bacteroidales bacterium]|jgi:hypothetical protein|nr:hypothetical protein [Bacteroidales bacterium]HQJ83192.1 hypothetical protein [Bacteroidales bacterium]
MAFKIKKNSSRFCLLFTLITAIPVHAQDLSELNKSEPFTISGSAGLTSSFYSASGIPDRQAPFAYGIHANATMTLYGIAMPFSFTWYNNSKVGFSQPFNQFGISPKYRWLTLHLGYRNLSFSEFTLSGYTFLGAGIEASPGRFRIGAMYGKFNQNSVYDLAMADSMPKMTRTGWAAKLGYGSEKRFVDLSVLRIGDDPKGYDTLNIEPGIPAPEQNIALGLTSRFDISEKLTFRFDGSYSFYTFNRAFAATGISDDALLRLAGNFIRVNSTSEYFKALKTSISYSFSQGTVTGIEYRRIDPGFRSMGSYFFNNDIEHLTINQSLALLKNKINLRGSLGAQRDNLKGAKEHTALRIIGSLTGNYNINQNWAVDATFNNFSTNQRVFRTATDQSLLIYQVNRTITLSPRYMNAGEKMSHMAMLNINVTALEDKNQSTSDMTETETYMAMLIYNLGLLQLKMNISAGLNYTMMLNKNFENRLAGGNINVAKTLLRDQLSLGLNNNLMINRINDDKGLILNSALTAAWRFHPKHSLSLNLNLINNRFAEGSAVPTYHEIRGDFGYAFTF